MKAIVQADPPDVHEPDEQGPPSPVAGQEPQPAAIGLDEAFTAPITGLESRPILRDALELLSQPAPVYDWVVPELLVREDRVVLLSPDLVAGTLFGWQLAFQAAVGLSISSRRLEAVRVLLICDPAHQELLRWALEALHTAAGRRLQPDHLIIVTVPGWEASLAWPRLAATCPDLVVTSVELPSEAAGFATFRIAAVSEVGDGEWLNWEGTTLQGSSLVFRLTPGRTPRALWQLRKEHGEFLVRPGWPVSLRHRPQALRRRQWPWSLPGNVTSDAKSAPAVPSQSADPVWAAILAYGPALARRLGRRPSHEQLAAELQAQGVDKHSQPTVTRAVRRHQAEFDRLFPRH